MSENMSGRALGLISLGIAATEMAAANQLEEVMGIGDGENTGIFRVLAVREFLHGIDLLTHDDPTPGLWGRVAGDMLDGVLLAVAGAKSRRPWGFLAIAAAVLPVVVADVLCATKSTVS